jgi:hypothetical protein
MDAPRYAFVSDPSDIVSVTLSGLANGLPTWNSDTYYVKGRTDTMKADRQNGGLGLNVKSKTGREGAASL